MNYKGMAAAQAKFDEAFSNQDAVDRIKKKFFALIVEIGESANESPSTFKFWSSNPIGSTLKNRLKYAAPDMEDDSDPLLEELVDVLRFLLSIGNEIGITVPSRGYQAKEWKCIVNLQLHFVKKVTTLYVQWASGKQKEILSFEYASAMNMYLSLVQMHGYSVEQLEDAFDTKGIINEERQANGY